MSDPRKVRCYAYVDRPYESVRAAIHRAPLALLERATTPAVTRATSLAASLRVGPVGVNVDVEVRLHVQSVREEEGVAGLSPVTHVSFGWEAARTPWLFPLMSAELAVWPLSASETQLEIEGDYRPPLGVVGTAIDAAVGYRIAEASVHKFLEDLTEQLQR